MDTSVLSTAGVDIGSLSEKGDTVSKVDERLTLLTVEQARPSVPISRGLFYEGLRKGEIPSIRVGGRILIPRARFEAWLAGEEKPAA